MDELFALEGTDELRLWAAARRSDETRRLLIDDFDRLRDYKNTVEWNRLVRVTDALSFGGSGLIDAYAGGCSRAHALAWSSCSGVGARPASGP
ncbi:hypothetical protein [Microbacterium sp. 22242]|uniref:hypothetical protein n=1 Tax=Microbacterium sp. 22242 TaxID=3453896 RepID=UPI003F82C901